MCGQVRKQKNGTHRERACACQGGQPCVSAVVFAGVEDSNFNAGISPPACRNQKALRQHFGNESRFTQQSARGLAQSKTLCAGRARHSVRAGVVNQNVLVGRRRRAEDCPPYPSRQRLGMDVQFATHPFHAIFYDF
jgi:hypothetical protein